ncbi:hypothetical protein SNEBB_010437 [Seison nebaliae]|nr:hypothetical protein SNEBB_010437 [Seison nebaliae]
MWPVKWNPQPFDSLFEDDDWSSFGDFDFPLTFGNRNERPKGDAYRIVMKLDDFVYQPENVKVTQTDTNRLRIDAEERKGDADNYNRHSFSKVLNLPKEVDVSKFQYKFQQNNTIQIIAPYITNNRKKLVETKSNATTSYNQFENSSKSGFLTPQIEGDKLKFTIDMEKYRTEDMNVEVKGHQLTVKGKKKEESDSGNSFVASSFQKSTTLPQGTLLETLKCEFDESNHRLFILANCNKKSVSDIPRNIPIHR